MGRTTYSSPSARSLDWEEEDSQCRRANRLELTDKGRLAAGRWKDECAQVNDMMLDGFNQNEKKMLEALLSRLIENLRRHRG